jgi:hypothetical protein
MVVSTTVDLDHCKANSKLQNEALREMSSRLRRRNTAMNVVFDLTLKQVDVLGRPLRVVQALEVLVAPKVMPREVVLFILTLVLININPILY